MSLLVNFGIPFQDHSLSQQPEDLDVELSATLPFLPAYCYVLYHEYSKLNSRNSKQVQTKCFLLQAL